MATPKWAIPTMAGTDLASTIDDTFTSAMTSLDDHAKYRSGVFASRPAATTGSGLYYYSTDTLQLFVSDGTNWLPMNVNPPRASLYSSAGTAGQAITTATDTAVTWTSRAGLSGVTITNGTSDFTPSMDGFYSFTLLVVWKNMTSYTAGTYRHMRLERTTVDSTLGYNPVHIERWDVPPSVTVNGSSNRLLSGLVRLKATETYRVMVKHDAGVTVNVQGPSITDVTRTYDYYTTCNLTWVAPL